MTTERHDADISQPAGAPAYGLSRRSVVRAGVGIAWTAPVVTLVTAAPAMAVSSTLAISAFTAAYQNSTSASTVRPDRLILSATLGNNGAQATAGFQFILSIPGGVFDSVSATAPAGFSGPAVSGSLGGGWTLVFTKSGSQIGPGASVAFASTITVGSTLASPYLGYRGSAFTLAGTASASNANTVGGAASVATTPNANMFGDMHVSTSASNSPTFTMTASNVIVSKDTSQSRSGIGQLRLSVSIPKGKKNSRLFSEPTQGAIGLGWASDGTAHTTTAWVFKYTSTAAGFAGSLGLTDATRGPGTFSSTLTLVGGHGNPHGDATWTMTAPHLNTFVETTSF